MKLLTPQTELKALRTICGDYEKISSLVMAQLTSESFYYGPAASAFKVIRRRFNETGSAPDWSEVISDPSINEAARKILKSCKEEPIRNSQKVPSIIDTLDKYRKLRALVNLSNDIANAIEDKALDLDKLLEETTQKLAAVRVVSNGKAVMHNFGKHNNTVPLMKELLNGERKPCVPTGFRAFDERNGGILLGSLWTIGANTGGGKTAMAVNVLRNMTEFAAEDCCIVPLEMTALQTTQRLMGLRTRLDVNKIAQGRLSDGEKKQVKASYKEYVQLLKQNNTRYSIWEPSEDLTIEETLLSLKPHGFKVIVIDYISLLKGADGDDQWRQLGAFARYAKVFAKNNNCIVVLLCQVSEEGKIRYAQSIAEHSNNCWVWTMNGDEADTSIMEVKQLKARNQQRFNFQLLSHNSCMLITDADDVSMESDDDEDKDNEGESADTENSKGGKKDKSKRAKGSKSTLRDLNEDSDSDEDEDED